MVVQLHLCRLFFFSSELGLQFSYTLEWSWGGGVSRAIAVLEIVLLVQSWPDTRIWKLESLGVCFCKSYAKKLIYNSSFFIFLFLFVASYNLEGQSTSKVTGVSLDYSLWECEHLWCGSVETVLLVALSPLAWCVMCSNASQSSDHLLSHYYDLVEKTG